MCIRDRGITTSWAGMYYSIPVDADKAQRIRLGVAAVSVDTNSDSDIKWSNAIRTPPKSIIRFLIPLLFITISVLNVG